MINFVGDINYTDGFFDLGFGIGSLIKNEIDPLQSINFDIEDIFIGNFECVCSNKSTKIGLEKNYFRISPKFVKCANRINVYGVANNHIMQHGSEAYYDTLSFIEENGSVYLGDKQKKYIEFNHKDYSMGIVNFSFRHENYSTSPLYWYIPDIKEIEKEYKNIKHNDLRVAYVHWGYEYMNFPSFDQKMVGRYLIDIGFNLVIGMHSHVLQGYEKYNNGYIFYSLGNFLFNMPIEECKRSVLLKVDLNNKKELIVDYEYVYLNRKGFPEIQDLKNVPYKFQFDYLNKKLFSVSNEKYFSEVKKTISRFRKKNYFFILRSFLKYRISDISQIIYSFIKRRLGND